MADDCRASAAPEEGIWEPLGEPVGPAGSSPLGVYRLPGCAFGEDALLLARFSAPARGSGCVIWVREPVFCPCTGTGCVPMRQTAFFSWMQWNGNLWPPPWPGGRWRKADYPPTFGYGRPICGRWTGCSRPGPTTVSPAIPLTFRRGAGRRPFPVRRRRPDAVWPGRRARTAALWIRCWRLASRLLKNGGRFCICHRPERLADLLSGLRACSLEPKRLRLLLAAPGDAVPWLVLCEAKKGAGPGLQMEVFMKGEEAP